MTTPLLEKYISATAKLHAERENCRYGRAHDVANELTDEEGTIVLLAMRLENGAVNIDLFNDEIQADLREVMAQHLQSEGDED
jgi:hypothetical protein